MNFYNILFAIGACCFPTEQVKMFDELPVELVILILSNLDPKSLSIMSRMNKRLFHICKNNKGLRTTIRRYLRKERKDQLRKMLNPIKVRVIRSDTETTEGAFQSRNAARETVITRNFDPVQALQSGRPVINTENTERVIRARNPARGTVITRNFDPVQALPARKRPVVNVSQKRSRSGQDKNPGPGLTKKMRI